MSKIIIYENYSVINEEIKDNSTTYNVDGENSKDILIFDSTGKIVDFKFKGRPVNPFLTGNNVGSKDMVTVTKEGKNFTGNILNFDKNKVFLKVNNKAVLINDYESIEFIGVPNLSSNVEIKDKNNNSFPFNLSYKTDKIKCEYQAIGMVKKELFVSKDNNSPIYTINLTVIAHIHNFGDRREIDVTLDSQDDKKSFNLNIGKKILEKGVNVFTIDEHVLTCKKVFYNDINANKTVIGFRVKEMPRLPVMNALFYEYKDGKIGKFYGETEIGKNSSSFYVDILLKNSDEIKVYNEVSILDKNGKNKLFVIEAVNLRDEQINLLSYYNNPTPIVSNFKEGEIKNNTIYYENLIDPNTTSVKKFKIET